MNSGRNFDWQNLRSLNGDQRNAFEEVCCQLFHQEIKTDGSDFERKGRPDSGVEACWILPDGQEEGIQCKFVLSPTDSLLSQLDESVKTTLDTHPDLIKYIICIPFDFPDGRVANRKSAREKYDTRVKKWVDWAADKNMQVEFVLWDSSELLSPERLLKPVNAGMIKYWFNNDFLTPEWFKQKFEEAKADVSKRYQPYRHINTEIENIFDGLLHTDSFKDSIRNLITELPFRWRNLKLDSIDVPYNLKEALLSAWNDNIPCVMKTIEEIDSTPQYPASMVLSYLDKIKDVCWDIEIYLSDKLRESEKNIQKTPQDTDNETTKKRYKIQSDYRQLQELRSSVESIIEYLSTNSGKLAENPFVLIKGEGGIGKTHLLCKIVEQHIENGNPSVLLLGGKFHNGQIVDQIIEQLDLTNCSNDEFLGALDTAAVASRTRALIAIDAINECSDPDVWRSSILGVLTKITRHPNVAVVLSIRSGTESFYLPNNIKEHVHIVYHQGLALETDSNISDYIQGYGIEAPAIPLMRPEFNNPLFLQIICDTLQRRGKHRFPQGHKGLLTIFNEYLDSINAEYTAKRGFDTHRNYIRDAMSALACKMADTGKNFIDRESAKTEVNILDPAGLSAKFANSLFFHMLHTGLTRGTHFWNNQDEKHEDGIAFMFERFADHLIAETLLKRYNSSEQIVEALTNNVLFKDLWKQRRWYSGGNSLVTAFSIQLPERYDGLELIDFYPDKNIPENYVNSFLDSVVWRASSAITDRTEAWILRLLNEKHENWRDKAFETLLSASLRLDHPLNAEWLHVRLLRATMSIRDAYWSTFLHRNRSYDNEQSPGFVTRLIDWCLSGKASQLDTESLHLYGLVLGWMLTSSNHSIRDQATKALAAIYTNNLKAMEFLLFNEVSVMSNDKDDPHMSFLDVDDPYVVERLLAAAYGAALRSTTLDGLANLAQKVYDRYYIDRNPPAHILLRDYTRGIIDFAVHSECNLTIDNNNLLPPYRSDFPTDPPSMDELDKLYGFNMSKSDDKRTPWAIHTSIMDGDFGIYTIGSGYQKGRLRDWLATRLTDSLPQSKVERDEAFKSSLTNKQNKNLKEFDEWNLGHILLPLQVSDLGEDSEEVKQEYEDAVKQRDKLLKTFLESLTEEQRIEYYAISEMEYGHEGFSGEFALCWVCHRAYNLGWNADLHGVFDANVGRHHYSRSRSISERIGKKYQWIAWHEFQALLSDHFYFSRFDDKLHVLRGSWELGVRDIDPSIILHNRNKRHADDCWWKQVKYDGWRRDDPKWYRDKSDLPDPKKLVEVVHSQTGDTWIILRIVQNWDQPQNDPTDEYRMNEPYAQIWYQLQPFLIPKAKLSPFKNWASKRLFHGPLMPEIPEFTSCFYREFHWAEPYTSRKVDSLVAPDRFSPDNPDNPHRYFLQAVYTSKLENNTDHSNDFSSSWLLLPCKTIVSALGLQKTDIEGEWINHEHKRVLYDPFCVGEGSQSTVVVRKDLLVEGLAKLDMALVWTLMGEKRLMSAYKKWPEGIGILDIGGCVTLEDNRLYSRKYTKFEGGKD